MVDKRCCCKDHVGNRNRSPGVRYSIINDDNVELYICATCVRKKKFTTE